MKKTAGIFFQLVIICSALTIGFFEISYGQTSEQQTSDLLRIGGMSKSYHAQGRIDFWVRNNTEKKLFFTCAAEKLFEDGWLEFVSSVEKTRPVKSTRVYKVKPKQSVRLSWNPMNQYSIVGKSQGAFRFAIRVYEEPGKNLLGVLYSHEFQILK